MKHTNIGTDDMDGEVDLDQAEDEHLEHDKYEDKFHEDWISN